MAWKQERNPDELLTALSRTVAQCDLCERMCHRTRVLSSGNGPTSSRVLFVAEAPGRLGADRTGIPLHGDRTGDNFESLLGNIGWNRNDVFITNAVLCNPRDENGNNATPSKREIINCSLNLKMTISVVNPDLIVTLGAVALQGLSSISPIRVQLKNDVGKVLSWSGRSLVPLYHPGPRAMIHRSILHQRSDYLTLAKLIDPKSGLKEQRKRSSAWSAPSAGQACATSLAQTALTIAQSLGSLSYFKLHKLMYLIDMSAIEQLGRSITGGTYLRMAEGPWLASLDKAVQSMLGSELETGFKSGKPYVSIGRSPRLQVSMDEESLAVIAAVLERHAGKNDGEIKTVVYRTEPMRQMRSLEKSGEDTRRRVVLGPDGW